MTLVTPHQRPTSGGVYAIEEIARNLSAVMTVNLIVLKGGGRSISDVAVASANTLQGDSIPDADAIVINADSPLTEEFVALPASKGKRFLYLQGYGTPGSEVVKSNLRIGFPVIASSKWLVSEAQQHGAKALHVPYGLDRSIFFPGRDNERRDNVVCMMTHSSVWKGTSDGIEALAYVTRQLPDTEVWFFGIEAPETDFPSWNFPKPSRAKVAELLRSSTVFVCSSWEEGFGMPGLEALACGAALATTDTKGCRDYAFDGETALVTPPNESVKLADSIARLILDHDLRKALTFHGTQFVRQNVKSWATAARWFAEGIERLSS